ncbi:MAG: ABC transporter permease [Deltaproteobacteria bacterium]|nr:MAG: ABC transporter permease [Deltaproteobacteria bacterium]
MSIYLLRRLYQALIVFFVVTLIVFLILHISGDPVQLLMPSDATQKDVQELRQALGLDKPLPVQYGLFLKNALKGNLGISYHHGQPALKLVLDRLPATLELVSVSMLISLILAVPLGVLASSRRGKWLDRSCLMGSLVGISAPSFWIGIAFILIFAVELPWFPSSGRGTWAHLVLPAASLSLYRLALFFRLIRAGMLDIMTQDYIRTARSKGVSEKTVIYKHALKNTLIPFITIAGLQMGSLLAGSIVTERIFAWPGMGRLFLDSIGVMDYPVIIAWTLVVSTIFILINLIVDVIYMWLDPRIRYEK